MSRPIALTAWAQRLCDPPPSSRTLRRWVQDGKIFPRPRKIGRAYFVPANARYIDTTNPDYLEDVAAALNESPPQ